MSDIELDMIPTLSTLSGAEVEESLKPELPFKTLIEVALPMQVDCVGWNHKYNVLAVGAYELDKNDTSIRKGFIYIIDGDLKGQQHAINYVQQKATSGILDLRWEPIQQMTLAVATSNSILIFQIELIQGRPMIEVTHEVELTTMALFIQWMSETRVLFSDSGGTVSIMDIHPEEAPEIVESNQLHEFLVWVVHFDQNMNCIFTGADDGKFYAFNVKDLMDQEKHFKKTFEVGVTSIITKEDLVGIGCYDDKLRLYTLKMESHDLEKPERIRISLIHQLEMNLGGAVWRTLWLPPIGETTEENVYHIAVACARNGVQIVSFNKSSWTWETLLTCNNHIGNLAYGLDVKVDKIEKSYVVASCYFDNHFLHIWKYPV